MWNRHRESKSTKLYEIGSGTKLLFTFFSLKVFRHEERETQSFYADCFYIVSFQPDQRAAPVAHKSSGLVQLWKSTFFLRGKNSTACFFSNLRILSPRFRWMTSFTPPGLISYLGILFWHLWMTHPTCARVNTRVNVAPNTCAKRKVLSQTKPKGKIYKTKSYYTQKNKIRKCQVMMAFIFSG